MRGERERESCAVASAITSGHRHAGTTHRPRVPLGGKGQMPGWQIWGGKTGNGPG
jgi:hypothetical protein